MLILCGQLKQKGFFHWIRLNFKQFTLRKIPMKNYNEWIWLTGCSTVGKIKVIKMRHRNTLQTKGASPGVQRVESVHFILTHSLMKWMQSEWTAWPDYMQTISVISIFIVQIQKHDFHNFRLPPGISTLQSIGAGGRLAKINDENQQQSSFRSNKATLIRMNWKSNQYFNGSAMFRLESDDSV